MDDLNVDDLTDPAFKACSACERVWKDRDGFLSDPAIILIGYQANFKVLEEGYFLFTHEKLQCGTSLGIQARSFLDLVPGPLVREQLTNTAACPGYCEDSSALQPCRETCECAYVREVIQVIHAWPKRF